MKIRNARTIGIKLCQLIECDLKFILRFETMMIETNSIRKGIDVPGLHIDGILPSIEHSNSELWILV